MLLNDRISEELKEYQERLTDDGALRPRSELEDYYRRFQQRFGPSALASMRGEELLEFIHGHGNRDSLVYWLEFKNDEEFPGGFGSISGGSALKFGIYRRKETGIWMTGTPANQSELSVSQAAKIAERNRDQFVRGAELIRNLPDSANDDDYRSLQVDLIATAPDVADTAWGHKYFSLLFPDKLDDYHNPKYQRFYLLSVLVSPAFSGDGRYDCAGQYVRIARELSLPLNHLTTILNRRTGQPYRYWRIGTKIDGTTSEWETMRSGDFIAVGFQKLGDLADLDDRKESKETLKARLENCYDYNPPLLSKKTNELFNFKSTIAVNDRILASDGATVLAVGRVTGEYYYQPGSDAPHRRPVEWLSLDAWKQPNPEGLQRTVSEVHRNPENLMTVEQKTRLRSQAPISPAQPGAAQRSSARPILRGVSARIQSILHRKGQVILYGPPGTGKTFWADKTARDLAALAEHELLFEDLDESVRREMEAGDPDTTLVRTCTFHPNYGYEDFIEGYRPVQQNGQLSFELRPGTFKKLCTDARQNPTKDYYLIIDEINRGDIPRIFGELLTIIEKNKRGKTVILPVSGEAFSVPDNVYVIGTMNTADRSIALLDTALRRRFGFVELMPDTTILKNVVIESLPLAQWLEALNSAIVKNVGRDARNLQVGHAYFLDNDGNPVRSFSKLLQVVRDDVIPLLEEYCYEDYETLGKILGSALVDTKGQRVRIDLLSESNKTEVIQALKAVDPNVDTSSSAVRADAESSEIEDLDDNEEDGSAE